MKRTMLKKLWGYKPLRISTWYFAITATLALLIILALLLFPPCQSSGGCLTVDVVGYAVTILVTLFISALLLLVALSLPNWWFLFLPKLALFVMILGILGYILPIMLVGVSWCAHGGIG